MSAPRDLVPLLTEERITQRVRELGRKISADFAGEEIILVGVLKGSFIFLADLARAIDVPTRIEFIGVASYAGTKSTGHVRITNDLSGEILGRNVILIEDIVDTGATLDYLLNTLSVRGPKTLKVCALLSKPAAHQMTHQLDYVGFEIGNEFVVGYGLDCDGRYRNLPDIKQFLPQKTQDQTNR